MLISKVDRMFLLLLLLLIHMNSIFLFLLKIHNISFQLMFIHFAIYSTVQSYNSKFVLTNDGKFDPIL